MEALKHECGIAMVRLLKPLEYYQQKYGTWMFGLNKLYLMMENSTIEDRKVLVWHVSILMRFQVQNICLGNGPRALMQLQKFLVMCKRTLRI